METFDENADINSTTKHNGGVVNTPTSYSGGPQFKSLCRDRLS